jgi:hypothetical protein
MKSLLDVLESHPVTIGLLVAALGLVVPVVRQAITRAFHAGVFLVRAPFIILEKVTGLEVLVTSMNARLGNVEHEMQDNDGGSIKDHTIRTENRHRADFWGRGRPAMELHANNCAVDLVSEAMCRLVGVRDTEHLLGRNWLRFVDSGQVEKMQDKIQEMADTENTFFRFAGEIFDDHRDSVGVWEFNAHAVDPPVAGKRLISGHWSPVNEKAKEISARYNWAC